MALNTPPHVDLCAIPAFPPPSGSQSNFVKPYSFAPVTLGVSTSLLVVAIAFVVLRVHTNFRRLRAADYFAVTALAFHAAHTGLICGLSKFNRHQWDVPACWFDAFYVKMVYCQTMTYGAALTISKISILLLYRDIFGVHRTIRLGIAVSVSILVAMLIIFIILTSLVLAPAAGQPWETALSSNANGNISVLWGIAVGGLSVALDLFILILPLPIVAKLNISKSQRSQLIAVFGTATLGVAASIVGLVFRVKLNEPSPDNTFGSGVLALANMIENAIALIVGCGPALSNFLRNNVAESPTWHYIRGKFGSSFGRSVIGNSSQRIAPQNTTGKSYRKHSTRSDEIELSNYLPQAEDANYYKRLSDEHTFRNVGGIVRTVDIHQQVALAPA